MTIEEIGDYAAEYSRIHARHSDETMAVDLFEAFEAGATFMLKEAIEGVIIGNAYFKQKSIELPMLPLELYAKSSGQKEKYANIKPSVY